MMWTWLSGGLFLGWAVGANVAANIFATAFAARMVRFTTVVKLSVVFVVLGGVLNGPAGMDTLNTLGGVGSLPAAFTVAFASAVAITCMSAAGLPVSAAQTGVGALIGHQLFQRGSIGVPAQLLLPMIVTTWICAPIASALTAFVIYKTTARIFRRLPMPLFLLDQWLRLGLLVAGCYGAWAFGGNNMANVMSFYMGVDLFAPIQAGPWIIGQSRILAFFGGVAISLGIATYSRRIMLTVGRDLVKLDGITALIAILSQALILDFLAHSWEFGSYTLPAIPVSVAQTLVGAILGLGLARGMQTIKLKILGNIVIGWIAAPIISASLAYVLLPLTMRLT
jgi:PiT family inorganic phosphate transporter